MEQMQPGDRQIRVFVSSTFRDMREDRDELVKRVFPRLRKICEDRHVAWGEVDLRWGITDEEKAEGRVLPVCLEEIKRCRPYFIGLLGERYGWVPPGEDIPEDLIQQQPWLAEHREYSVTELEILHGVLRNPNIARHAFFYFRDPDYAEGRPPEEFREVPTDEEIRRFGREEAERRAGERRKKLSALKERIRRTEYPVREDYADPKELGRLVLEDFTRLIDELYPEEEVPDPLEREAREHEDFARSRAGVYIGRDEYFRMLDEHVDGDGPPLAVLGESGSGKSALLSNWALRRREEHPDEHLILHFIGASPSSADWRRMARRIMGELKRRFDIEQDIPTDPGELRAAFAEFLYMADARGRVTIVLDALNRLEEREGARELTWLPPVVPDNVRLVVSTLAGPALDAVEDREWPTLRVEPLEEAERRRLIDEFLDQYSKKLSARRADRIGSAPQTENPLYLRVLLDELRQFGRHEDLDARIDHYLGAEDPDDLYDLVLERWEKDYERDRPGLVADAMRALWAARRGLSEAELLDFLGSGGGPLPAAHWSPLRLAAGDGLLSRSGLLTFGHAYLRRAVRDRCLAGEDRQRKAHAKLADYFEGQELGDRKVDELPWQLSRAGEWRRLYDLLADLSFFEAAWEADEEEVLARWAEVEGNSELRKAEAYRRVLEAPGQCGDVVSSLASVFRHSGDLSEALRLREYLVERYREDGDRVRFQASLGGKANILADRGDLKAALELYEKGESICRELGLRADLRASLGNQANILYQQGDVEGAMKMLGEEEGICREMGDRDGLQRSLGSQGVILKHNGDLEGAMKLYEEKERICRELGLQADLGRSLGYQAKVLYHQGDLRAAMDLYREQESICRELGLRGDLQDSLGHQGNILAKWGDLGGAMQLYEEKERICRELGLRSDLQRSLGNQANVLYLWGELERALELHKEDEHICRELGLRADLQASLGNQGVILKDMGDLDGAMKLYEEKERICRDLGLRDGLQASLSNQANILYRRGNMKRAMDLHKEVERICRKLGLRGDLQRSLGNQGAVLMKQGDLEGAMALYKEEERICREVGLRGDLQRSLGNQANVLYQQGNVKGAMELYEEQERICRELGLSQGLMFSLANQALVLANEKGQIEVARSLAEEAHQIATRHGYRSLAGRTREILEGIRGTQA